jgi:hypothetical protein
MSDEGVCVFEKNSRFPDKLRAPNTDHEWVLTLGFDGDVSRSEFLDGLKSILRDYWYMERTKDSSISLKREDVKTPISGQLYIYLTETRNLAVAELLKRLPSNVYPDTLQLDIKIGFKSPRSLDGLFSSVYIDTSLLNEMNTNLKKDDIIISGRFKKGSGGKLSNDVDWRTEDSPAGFKCDLGRLAIVSKSNIQLTFSASTTVIIKGEPITYDFGSGE